MEKNVEDLIQKGVKCVKTETALSRKLIEAYAAESESTVKYFTKLYQEYSFMTDSIITELLTKEKISSEMLTKYFGTNLMENEHETMFFFIFLRMEFLNECSKLSDNYEEIYFAENSVEGERVVLLLNACTNYLQNNKFENQMQKIKFLDFVVNKLIHRSATRQFFKGNTELATSLCTPELHLNKNEICEKVSFFADISLKFAVYSISTFFDIDAENVENVTIKLDLISVFAQCEKYGIDVDLERYTTDPKLLEYLQDIKNDSKQLLGEKSQLLKNKQ